MTLAMTSFSDRLFRAIQDGCESLYGEFVHLCREILPPDIDERYEWLKNNGYAVRDDADIAVYVHKVAARHQPKFQWLYDNLFQQYPNVFQGELDLVVWGCGCGLDLLALYDRAMKQGNPQLWLTVRSVTLLDISETALSCAKEFAELLFPCARGRIVGHVCDFKDFDSEKIGIPNSFIYTPRLHLISNVLDLLSQEQLAVFVAKQKQCTARNSYFNEMFVAFSPEYRNWDRTVSRQKLEAFRAEWGEKATDVSVSGDEPANCVYATFEYNDLLKDNAYRLYASANRCLRNIVRGRNRCLDEGCSDKKLAYLQGKLSTLTIGDKNFFECYEWADVQKYVNKRDEAVIDRILFVPRRGVGVVPCVIVFGWHSERAPNPKEIAWKSLLKTSGLDERGWNQYAEKTKVLRWDYKNKLFRGDTNFGEYLTQDDIDFSDAFVIDPKGAKPLPSLDDAMDSEQREIILGRQQLRRIRGGAGCGKTTTMLWHGVMSILRMHQPVLMACRTVTLFRHNQRRMAATLMSRVDGLEYVDRGLVRFSTIDKFLCEYFLFTNQCAIRNSKEQQLDNGEKELLCRKCKSDGISRLCKDKTNAISSTTTVCFGAVMVDEIQSVEPDMVQALYNLTEAGNSNREFYCFCDERQSLKQSSLEKDEQIQKLRVKTPKGTKGRSFSGGWKSLNRPYRQMEETSGVLTEVAYKFQKLTDDKYGDNETERRVYQPGLVNVFSIERVNLSEKIPQLRRNLWKLPEKGLLENKIIKIVDRLKDLGSGKITVICDTLQCVRRLLMTITDVRWRSTHTKDGLFVEEQALRNSFEETEDCIGLTTIELAQGWDLENVILIITRDKSKSNNEIESVTTGITRAKCQLRIIDASPSGWVYEQLKRFN